MQLLYGKEQCERAVLAPGIGHYGVGRAFSATGLHDLQETALRVVAACGFGRERMTGLTNAIGFDMHARQVFGEQAPGTVAIDGNADASGGFHTESAQRRAGRVEQPRALFC
ncbi:hypothetical protein [Pandoraea sp. XY-2]|uniref:hypothetical protein n=1 Tax=Pandoraea sp. XY-2 TaxID=2518599 RepID=UPI0013EEBAB1|nr:hypothetical protein [Pandoraea sp. XY-2]